MEGGGCIANGDGKLLLMGEGARMDISPAGVEQRGGEACVWIGRREAKPKK